MTRANEDLVEQRRKLWGQPLTRDSSPMQGKAFEVSISRTYLVLLAKFGGKGDRQASG